MNDTISEKDIAEKFLDCRVSVFVFLGITIFVAHFLYSCGFGLYEDDFSFFPKFLNRDMGAIAGILSERLGPIGRGDLGAHGRPFAAFFQELFAVIGSSIAGLWGIYLMGFLLQALNAFLVFILLSRRVTPLFALMSAITFALFPADTIHSFLNGIFGILPAMTFLLLALIYYLKGRRFISYLLITGALLSYESLYFPFLAAPLLLELKWDRPFLKKLAIHAFVMTVILAVILLLRASGGGGGGEGRVSEMSSYAADIPMRLIQSILVGVGVSLFYSFFNAAIEVIKNLDTTIIFTIILFSSAFAFIFQKKLHIWNDTEQAVKEDTGDFAAGLLKLIIAGLAIVMLSYLTAFYELYQHLISYGAHYGRSSRVHIPAALGAGIVVPSIFFLIYCKAGGLTYKRTTVTIFSVLLAFLVGYAIHVQYDYKEGFRMQRWLWTSIIRSSPDIEDGTLILVEKQGIPDTKFIDSHSWFGVPHALNYIYRFPEDWKSAPRMNYKEGNWIDQETRLADGKLQIYLRRSHHFNSAPPRWVDWPQGNVILFKRHGNKLTRIDGSLDIKGKKIKLKPRPLVLSEKSIWPKGVLYDIFVKDAPYIKGAWFDGEVFKTFSPRLSSKLDAFTIELWLRPGEKNS
ncbi:MAG: hypothetical protein V3T30_03030, partial [Thermodesulfobacteriota bacterium]